MWLLRPQSLTRRYQSIVSIEHQNIFIIGDGNHTKVFEVSNAAHARDTNSKLANELSISSELMDLVVARTADKQCRWVNERQINRFIKMAFFSDELVLIRVRVVLNDTVVRL